MHAPWIGPGLTYLPTHTHTKARFITYLWILKWTTWAKRQLQRSDSAERHTSSTPISWSQPCSRRQRVNLAVVQCLAAGAGRTTPLYKYYSRITRRRGLEFPLTVRARRTGSGIPFANHKERSCRCRSRNQLRDEQPPSCTCWERCVSNSPP